jgi:Predicted nucleotide-binding protein containing TIR-like domain
MAGKAKRVEPEGRRPPTEAPKHSIEAALVVPQALEDKNGGNPLPPMDVALAIGMSPGSSSFRDLLSSSIKYGFTSGSFNQPKVSMEALGKAAAAPKSPDEKRSALLQAMMRPDTFRRVYDYYKGKKLPEPQFLGNTLVREFAIAKENVDKFVEVFNANVTFLGLAKESPSGKWLSAELETADSTPSTDSGPSQNHNTTVLLEKPKPPVSISSASPDPVPSLRNAIFVGHGKDKGPREQLEKILAEYQLPFKVAEDEANRGRPISQKVAEIMHECGAAILIFTADEEFTAKNGDTIYRPSENVVFELGAASVLYGSRIVIFRDSRVQFPTNFRDIGYITFETNNLAAKVNELFRELIGFGLIKISVAS